MWETFLFLYICAPLCLSSKQASKQRASCCVHKYVQCAVGGRQRRRTGLVTYLGVCVCAGCMYNTNIPPTQQQGQGSGKPRSFSPRRFIMYKRQHRDVRCAWTLYIHLLSHHGHGNVLMLLWVLVLVNDSITAAIIISRVVQIPIMNPS